MICFIFLFSRLQQLFELIPCMQAVASITAQNFLAPADDLGYKVEYRHPYFFSARDPKRTALAVSIFNARKISGVFTPGELLLCRMLCHYFCAHCDAMDDQRDKLVSSRGGVWYEV